MKNIRTLKKIARERFGDYVSILDDGECEIEVRLKEGSRWIYSDGSQSHRSISRIYGDAYPIKSKVISSIIDLMTNRQVQACQEGCSCGKSYFDSDEYKRSNDRSDFFHMLSKSGHAADLFKSRNEIDAAMDMLMQKSEAFDEAVSSLPGLTRDQRNRMKIRNEVSNFSWKLTRDTYEMIELSKAQIVDDVLPEFPLKEDVDLYPQGIYDAIEYGTGDEPRKDRTGIAMRLLGEYREKTPKG